MLKIKKLLEDLKINEIVFTPHEKDSNKVGKVEFRTKIENVIGALEALSPIVRGINHEYTVQQNNAQAIVALTIFEPTIELVKEEEKSDSTKSSIPDRIAKYCRVIEKHLININPKNDIDSQYLQEECFFIYELKKVAQQHAEYLAANNLT